MHCRSQTLIKKENLGRKGYWVILNFILAPLRYQIEEEDDTTYY